MNIRTALYRDADAIAKVYVRTWRSTYSGIVPTLFLEQLDEARSADRWRDLLENDDPDVCHFVAEADRERIVGFASGGPNRDKGLEYDGELYAIYILQEYQGQGIGSALFSAVRQWLAARGHASMVLWVLSQNPANAFYEAMGGTTLTEKEIEIGGAVLMETCYGWSRL